LNTIDGSEGLSSYEQLRAAALCGLLAQGSAALGVLLHHGLAALLRAKAPLPRRGAPASVRHTAPLPAAIASIILRLTKEAVHA